MKRGLVLTIPAAIAIAAYAQTRRAGEFSVVEASIPEMRTALEQHQVTSRELVDQYLARIGTYEDILHAAVAVNPHALREAADMDRERAQAIFAVHYAAFRSSAPRCRLPEAHSPLKAIRRLTRPRSQRISRLRARSLSLRRRSQNSPIGSPGHRRRCQGITTQSGCGE